MGVKRISATEASFLPHSILTYFRNQRAVNITLTRDPQCTQQVIPLRHVSAVKCGPCKPTGRKWQQLKFSITWKLYNYFTGNNNRKAFAFLAHSQQGNLQRKTRYVHLVYFSAIVIAKHISSHPQPGHAHTHALLPAPRASKTRQEVKRLLFLIALADFYVHRCAQMRGFRIKRFTRLFHAQSHLLAASSHLWML